MYHLQVAALSFAVQKLLTMLRSIRRCVTASLIQSFIVRRLAERLLYILGLSLLLQKLVRMRVVLFRLRVSLLLEIAPRTGRLLPSGVVQTVRVWDVWEIFHEAH